MTTVRLVALVGAECTGKTELARRLAERLGGLWVPEWLREFCDREARTPRIDEQEDILREQIAREQAALAAARAEGRAWVFADSAPLATATGSELYFADRSLWPAALAHHARYDATLFTATDLPWVADGIQRDGEPMRGRFHARLAQALDAHRIVHAVVTGFDNARLDCALEALNRSTTTSTTR